LNLFFEYFIQNNFHPFYEPLFTPNQNIMKTTGKFLTLMAIICTVQILCYSCSDTNDSLDIIEAYEDPIFNDLGSEVEIITADNRLKLILPKEDFESYQAKYNLKSTLKIKNGFFECQKKEYFSNKIWIIQPDDILFENPIKLSIDYTHEEFSPEFKTEGLRIYRLNREYQLDKQGNEEKYLIRVSDMTMLNDCMQNVDDMHVSTEILGFGGYVLGREVK